MEAEQLKSRQRPLKDRYSENPETAVITLTAAGMAGDEIEIRGGILRAEGDLDFRGTLGVSRDAPVGFRSIRLLVDLDTDASKEEFDSLIALTERYCVVFQTLANAPALSVVRT